MIAFMKYLSAALFIILLIWSCNTSISKETAQTPSLVEINSVDGKYNFYVNGEMFELKGAGGNGNLGMLQKAGGNSIRTWSPNNGRQILDSAQKYNIMVAMGISMGQELHNFDYDDVSAVEAQYKRNIQAINELKDHPALLCWVIGNELNLSKNHRDPVNPKVYDALKDIVDYIHENDPNHPATTAVAGVNKEHIKVILERCPNLDFISLQVYGGLANMSELVKAAEINKPFAITEYGPMGHWEMPQTTWGREIEEPSAKKASGIYERIQKGIVNDPTGLCLGGYAFLWGQKQERTPTWYGIFLKSGETTAVLDELTRYWTGNYPETRAPQVDDIKLNGKNAVENVYVSSGARCVAKVSAFHPNGDALTFHWEILKEVDERSQGGAREKEPDMVSYEIISGTDEEIIFIAPEEKGEYRLFSYVFDDKMKAGTANIPFMVE
jgi:hypothetical protein